MMGLTLFIRKRKVPTHPDLIVFYYFWQKREKSNFFARTLAAKKRSRRSRLVLSSWRRTSTIRWFVKPELFSFSTVVFVMIYPITGPVIFSICVDEKIQSHIDLFVFFKKLLLPFRSRTTQKKQ